MLSKFFIYRPIFATVLSLVIMVAGATAYFGLPIAEYPDLAPPTIQVSAFYPGADTETIAQTVASPIEQEVNGVEGMLYMSSTSSSDGRYALNVTFETGTDLDIATVQVQNRIAIAESGLPEAVRRLGISTKKRMPDFAQMVSITSSDGQYDDIFLSNFATLQLRDQLKRVEGVGDVQVFGAAEYAMRIWIDPDKLVVRNLTTVDVLNAIREQNVQVAAGVIGQPPSSSSTPFQYSVTTKGQLQTPEEFEQIIVRSEGEGRTIRLGDIARVELGAENYSMDSRVNGSAASVLAIFQLPGANLIEISDGVRALLAELQQGFPDGVEVDVTYDAAIAVRASIREIVVTLFIASGLVVLTVLVFLQDLRSTIIPAVTIPVSLVGTFLVMSLLGFSLNTLTLFGLVLAIGIVVDDAIVVVENVARNLERPDVTPKQAAEEAMREVSGPVIATTLVLLAVFVPTSFMGGITGVMYQQFGLTIAAATVFSSINALTLSPALCGVLMRRSTKQKNPLFRFFDHTINSSTRWYSGIVNQAVRKSAITMVVFLIVAVGGSLMFTRLPTGFVPQEDKGVLMAAVQLPDAASRERTREVTERIDAMLASAEGVDSYIQIGGYSMIDSVANPNVASFIITLEDWSERTTPSLSQAGVAQSIQMKLMGIQEAAAFAFEMPPIPGVGNSVGFDMQVQDRGGLGAQTLQSATQQLIGAASGQSGVAGLNSGFRATVPQLYINIDREKVKQLGLPLSTVFDTIQTNLGSTYANDFIAFNSTFQVQVQGDVSFRSEPEDILMLRVPDGQGGSIPLATVATVEQRFGPSSITRYNQYPAAAVRGQPGPGFSSGQALDLMEQTAGQVLPVSMGFEWTGLAYQEKQTGSQVGVAFGLAILLVFFVLAAQYESWTLPVAVLLAVPLGFIGVAGGVIVRGFDSNVYTQIGVVLLIALISKNAILIIEFARAKHDEGLSVTDAAIESATLRFRPILMTAFSFVLGTAPLVIATGAGAGARTALGTAVFAGLIVATILGVFMTPALYRVVQGGAERLSGRG
jgi:HAE1 family hydrophobic/amphiphilic exporter-1